MVWKWGIVFQTEEAVFVAERKDTRMNQRERPPPICLTYEAGLEQ